ncbi:MAG: hypothetical protein AABY22_06435 [Nanoarchaeota archaeon]
MKKIKEKKFKADKADIMCRYPLATKTGIEMMIAMLLHDGAMCPKCGYGTGVTSKIWTKWKKCGAKFCRTNDD